MKCNQLCPGFELVSPCPFPTNINIISRVENGFKLAKKKSKRYPAQTITDADYADDIELLANTPTQAKSLIHSLERAAGDISLQASADKTEYMCFGQRVDISTLKLVDKFT